MRIEDLEVKVEEKAKVEAGEPSSAIFRIGEKVSTYRGVGTITDYLYRVRISEQGDAIEHDYMPGSILLDQEGMDGDIAAAMDDVRHVTGALLIQAKNSRRIYHVEKG